MQTPSLAVLLFKLSCHQRTLIIYDSITFLHGGCLFPVHRQFLAVCWLSQKQYNISFVHTYSYETYRSRGVLVPPLNYTGLLKWCGPNSCEAFEWHPLARDIIVGKFGWMRVNFCCLELAAGLNRNSTVKGVLQPAATAFRKPTVQDAFVVKKMLEKSSHQCLSPTLSFKKINAGSTCNQTHHFSYSYNHFMFPCTSTIKPEQS